VAPGGPAVLGNPLFTSLGNKVCAFALDTCTPAPELPLEESLCAPAWVTDLGVAAGSFWTHTIVAVGADAIAVPAADKTVRVLDAATGAARWRTAAVTGSIGGIAVGRGSLYVGAESGLAMYAASGCGGATCASSWSHNTGGDLVHAIVWNSRIYLTDADTGDVEALHLPAS